MVTSAAAGTRQPMVAVVGAGPAGLMAAEVLSQRGYAVTIYDRMPSPARKFLMAGRGGLNLTHSEPLEMLLGRYGAGRDLVAGAIAAFLPDDLRAWSAGLGQDTFVGSSGRVFPKALKASPLLRTWLRRLEAAGVALHVGRRWIGWDQSGALLFVDAAGASHRVAPDATVLALGGASWPRLGSDGEWATILAAAGIPVRPLVASNCGAAVSWSAVFRDKFAGVPLKRIALSAGDARVRGEAVVTAAGLEGGAIYALSDPLRRELSSGPPPATLSVDLRPDRTVADLSAQLAAPRGKQSAATFLRKTLSLAPVDVGLLHEASGRALPTDADALARLIKAVPLRIEGLAGLDRAISSAGGVARDGIDTRFMLVSRPGVFVAGEMLDWDAPTGGYLLQATLSTAVAAAAGLASWLGEGEWERAGAGPGEGAGPEISPNLSAQRSEHGI